MKTIFFRPAERLNRHWLRIERASGVLGPSHQSRAAWIRSEFQAPAAHRSTVILKKLDQNSPPALWLAQLMGRLNRYEINKLSEQPVLKHLKN